MQSLPRELQLLIAGQLSLPTLGSLACTCTYFSKLCATPQLWTSKSTQDFPQYYGCKCAIPPRLYYQVLHTMVPMRDVMGDVMFKSIDIERKMSAAIQLVYPLPPLRVYDEGDKAPRFYDDDGRYEIESRYQVRPDVEILSFDDGPIMEIDMRIDYVHLGLLEGITCPSLQDIPACDRPFYSDNIAFAHLLDIEAVLIYRKDLKLVLTRARDLGFLTFDMEYIRTSEVEYYRNFFSVIDCDD
jgi:hypothetical protein